MIGHSERTSIAIASLLGGDAAPPNADFSHWRKLHKEIFGTMLQYRAGEMRQASDARFEWIKNRSLDNGRSYEVLYAHTDNPGEDVDKVLGQYHKTGGVAGLNHADASEKLAKLYADLDYVHPFNEGNSRSLRAFMSQLARKDGYDLSWGKTNETVTARDDFYLSRDREVIERRFPGLSYEQAIKTEDRREYETFFFAKGTPEMRQAPWLRDIIAAGLSVDVDVLDQRNEDG